MPFKLNENIYPPGGFVFKDGDGVTHLGDNLQGLVKTIARYRATTGQPAGDPEQEFLAKLCKRAPRVCLGEDSPSLNLKALAIYVAKHISKTSLAVTRGSASKTLQDGSLAVARLEACKHCPHCVDWSKGCAPCQRGSATLLVNAIHPHAPVPGSEKLACTIARDSLAITIFDQNPASIQNPPDFCWRKGQAA
jgi:hypothetical protein